MEKLTKKQFDNLKLLWNCEQISLTAPNVDTCEEIEIFFAHSTDWERNPDLTIDIISIVELFYTNKVRLLEKLGYVVTADDTTEQISNNNNNNDDDVMDLDSLTYTWAFSEGLDID